MKQRRFPSSQLSIARLHFVKVPGKAYGQSALAFRFVVPVRRIAFADAPGGSMRSATPRGLYAQGVSTEGLKAIKEI